MPIRPLRPLARATTLAFAVAATSARADFLIGNANSDGDTHGVIHAFADGADGDVAPLRSIVPGSSNPITSAYFIEYEPHENVIYVADFWGQAIRVYDPHASGDVSPLRTMNPAQLAQTRAVRIDRAHDEMVTIASNCCVYTWPRLANGSDVAAIRRIPWGGNNVSASQLNNPGGLALNLQREEIVVGDYAPDSPAYTNRILVFARTTDGASSTPQRVISGPNTQLGRGTNVRVAIDEETQTLFALAGARNDDDGGTAARILAFAADADGDAMPIRTIEGLFAGLELEPGESLSGFDYDRESGHLVVSISDGSNSRILVHSKNGFGNALPLATISGTSTGLASYASAGVSVPDRIFKNGFDSF